MLNAHKSCASRPLSLGRLVLYRHRHGRMQCETQAHRIEDLALVGPVPCQKQQKQKVWGGQGRSWGTHGCDAGHGWLGAGYRVWPGFRV